MLDAVGSKRALRKLAALMRKNGIEVTALLPVGLFRRGAARFDLRNHRKIAVIDGRMGYTGSQNINDGQFVPGFPNEEMVARVVARSSGNCRRFSWRIDFLETNTLLEDSEAFPGAGHEPGAIAQVMPSGPGYGRENGQTLMISLLYAARERVVLTTPYFVPDEPFLEAMTAAARRGVSMHLVVSAMPIRGSPNWPNVPFTMNCWKPG